MTNHHRQLCAWRFYIKTKNKEGQHKPNDLHVHHLPNLSPFLHFFKETICLQNLERFQTKSPFSIRTWDSIKSKAARRLCGGRSLNPVLGNYTSLCQERERFGEAGTRGKSQHGLLTVIAPLKGKEHWRTCVTHERNISSPDVGTVDKVCSYAHLELDRLSLDA